MTCIVGANACGKSTVLRAMARLLRPRAGRVVLDGADLRSLPTKQVARTLGLLPQAPTAPEGIVVGDLVARGRHPHQGPLGRWTAADEEAVAEALALTGTDDLVDRPVDELSGGQRQRTWIAMALAQQTDLLLLDEPTTFLDVAHQVEVLDLLTDLNRRRGTTVVMVLHDLNLAARYADHLVAVPRRPPARRRRPRRGADRGGGPGGVRARQPGRARPRLGQAGGAAHRAPPRPRRRALRGGLAVSALLADVQVVAAHRLSPSFVRLELGGPALADLRDGPWWDQRIKLVVPGDCGVPLASELEAEGGGDWYAAWSAAPESSRGVMRTYTVRGVRGSGRGTRLLVDVVLHPGAQGPGALWAAVAGPGSRALLVAPRRGADFGGVEFRPPPTGGSAGGDAEMLLVADETAVPAVGSILDDWPAGLRGTAYLEVPGPDDLLDLRVPPGVDVRWLPRGPGDEVGDRLLPAVRRHVGLRVEAVAAVAGPAAGAAELAWETPEWSASGEPLDAPGPRAPVPGADDLHAWVAGESGWVTAVRRVLVREVGVPRGRVAFMGYWRRGVAMRG